MFTRRVTAAPTRTVNKPVPVFTKKNYALPNAPIEPVEDLGAYSWLFYGQKKIGKSTLASLFPDAVFFMFEPGAKALRVYRLDIGTWEDALGYLAELEKHPKQFKTAVIDTGFEAYEKCMAFVCAKLKIDYPREDNFGKDWKAISTEFRNFMNRLSVINLGVVVLCHETIKENMTYTGNKYDQIIPNLSKAADSYFRATIDNVAWYHYRGKQRFLQIRGSDAAMAGLALQADKYFKTPAGESIFAIPIPSEPKKGMDAILIAFKNKQTNSYKDETEKFSEEVVKHSINEKMRKESRRRN